VSERGNKRKRDSDRKRKRINEKDGKRVKERILSIVTDKLKEKLLMFSLLGPLTFYNQI